MHGETLKLKDIERHCLLYSSL